MPRLPRIGGGAVRPRAGMAISLTLLLSVGTLAARADGPAVPAYPHKSVRHHAYGEGARSYSLFEPAEPSPERVPVVVLNHGWLAINPAVYGAWITHLVRSGHIVIFPKYQADSLTPPSEFLPNALAAVGDALDVLETAPGHVRPDRERYAVVGHSAGGNLAAQMAAVAPGSRLPTPKAVIALLPGEVQPSREPDLGRIPRATLMVVAAAEDDVVVGDGRAREIFSLIEMIPTTHKKYILFRSDLHGAPWLIAHHFAPTALDKTFDNGEGFLQPLQFIQADVNALDRSGFWRLTDLTLAAAFAGQTLDEATEGGALFLSLGFWSDGRPVTPPIVGDDLSKIPRTLAKRGVQLFSWPAEIKLPGFVAERKPGRVVEAAAVRSGDAIKR